MSFNRFWSREVRNYKGIRLSRMEWVIKPSAVRAYSRGFEEGVARVMKILNGAAQSDPDLARRFFKKSPV